MSSTLGKLRDRALEAAGLRVLRVPASLFTGSAPNALRLITAALAR